MRKLAALFALWLCVGYAWGVTLDGPVFAPANGINYLGPVYFYNTGTFYPQQLAQGLAAVASYASIHPTAPLDWLNTTGVTLCMTKGVTLPTAPTPGTCGGGSNTVTSTVAISPALTGTAQLNLLATKAGSTNSPVESFTFTFQPNVPVAGTYAYGVAPVLTGLDGQNIIYTTDGSTPAASGSCVATGTGTAIANGTAITALSVGTTTVKASACLSGTLTSIGSWVYVVNAISDDVLCTQGRRLVFQ